MSYDRAELEGLDRESLVARAQEAGIRRARILTRPELIDELLRSDPSVDEKELKKTRGFFGKARDLVARVVERGLHLPDAADRIRTLGTLPASVPRTEPQAVPTVTLAEIYAAQGHSKRAIATLKLVLDREPDHAAAKSLLAKLEDSGYVAPPPPLPPEPEVEPDPRAEPDDEEPTVDLGRDVGMHAATEVDVPVVDSSEALTQPWGDAPNAEDAEDAKDEITQVDETKTIDMLLAEYVDEPTSHGSGTNGHAKPAKPAKPTKTEDPAYAPTHVLPKKSGVSGVIPAAARSECVAVPMGRGRTFVRWFVADREGASSLVLRAYIVTPSWDGPTADTRDFDVDADDGETVVHDIPDRAVVRAAIGIRQAGAFVPLAHSPAIEAAGRGLVVWSPKGSEPLALDDPRSAFLARAAHAARRAAQV